MSSLKQEPPAAESVKVNIFGQTYSLRSPQGTERVRRLAGMIDERMREISSHLAVHDAVKVAVLAALNLADELELVREHYEREIETLLTREPEPEDEGPAPEQATSEQATSAQATSAHDTARGAETMGEAAGRSEAESAPGPEPVEPASPVAAGDSDAGAAGAARRSWFDEIFDTEFSPGGGPGRLSSQVSTRLQRLRQATREGSISAGETSED
jgi:cell division protein ZapA